MEAIARREAHELDGAGDHVLVGLARQGDETAVRILVRRYNRRLYRVARAVLRNDAEAEDVVQEAYVSAFSALAKFRGDASFATWITRIALNAALGRKRRHRPTVAIEGLPDGALEAAEIVMFPSSQLNPEQAMARSQVRELLEQVVEELPETFRMVFVLRDIEGLGVDETARHLGIKPATVKTRLHRARKLMRSGLADRAAATLPDLFPFAGRRCERMADRVVAILRTEKPDFYPGF